MGYPWKSDELALLADMYPHCHTYDVAEWLGRSTKSVYEQAKASGVRKTADYLASNTACRIKEGRTDPRMVASQFRPGLTPWNKGKPHPAGRNAGTFKKGVRVGAALVNFVPVGTFRINSDGILQQKVAASGRSFKDWKSYALVVWEREHGPVPEGSIVVFRQGLRTTDPQKLTSDRLECITRAENARRNHPANRSPELARLLQLKGAITSQLRRIEKEHASTAHQ